MTVFRSGASVTGRDVHQVYFASQTAIEESAIATCTSARICAACGRSTPSLPISSRVHPLTSPAGLLVPHQIAARSCSKLRLAANSWTILSSASHAGDPYAGGGAGRNWAPLVITQVVQEPASGLSGVSTNPGGV